MLARDALVVALEVFQQPVQQIPGLPGYTGTSWRQMA
jgi:hypothetical protein